MIDLAQITVDLESAAAVMETNGLHRRAFYDHEQVQTEKIPAAKARVCTLGAVSVAATGIPDHTGRDIPRHNAVKDHLYEYLLAVHGLSSIIDWNDQPDCTAEQAAALLREAAAWRPAAEAALATVA